MEDTKSVECAKEEADKFIQEGCHIRTSERWDRLSAGMRALDRIALGRKRPKDYDRICAALAIGALSLRQLEAQTDLDIDTPPWRKQ